MVSTFLAVVLFFLTVVFLRQQKALERRIAAQRDVPHERLLPRHYKSFTEIENKLWAITHGQQQSGTWDTTRLRLQETGLQLVWDYVRALREDFQQGHRIFGRVILHSPEMKLLVQLEWERLRLEFSYYHWYALVSFRLRTGGISPEELRQLTQIVATLAYRVRNILSAFESSGNLDFVDSVLRNS